MRGATTLLITWLFSFSGIAQQRSEKELVAKIFAALQAKDVVAYEKLYANTDSLSSWILQYADVNSESYKKMYFVKDNAIAKETYDALIRTEIQVNLDTFLKKANKLGIHWKETVFVRYELDKIRTGRGLMIEKVATLRFLGYVFFKDNFTRKNYGFTVYDIMQVNGNWYGGELVNIFEAQNKEQYEKALTKEKNWMRDVDRGTADKKNYSDTTHDEAEDNRASNMKEVVDRKFYKGKFDNEISVELYVRYIKGPCQDGVCSWEALFRFGDQDEYVPMSVTRTKEGKWVFSEDLGGMELDLEGNVYTGTWAAGDTKTEYDVLLKETSLSTKKANALDEAMDLMDVPE